MNDLQVHLIHADMLTIGKSWNAREVRSSFWRLYINNRDGAGVWTADGWYPLPAGRVHLIPAYVRFTCQNEASIRHLYVHFDLLGVTPALQERTFARPASLPVWPEATRLLRLYGQGRFPPTCPVAMCQTLAVAMGSLARMTEQLPHAARQQLADAFAAPNPIRPALQLLEQRLPMGASVPELAEACAFSPDHFARLFRTVMQQTPGQYVLQRRIALAARQLLYGTRSIDSIAQEHGFANRFHFTRAFCREMGTTPAAYRKSQRV